MTIVYTERVDSEERTQLLQWGISLALVLMLHVAVAYFLFFHEVKVEQKPVPPAAYLDLTPIQVPKQPGSTGAPSVPVSPQPATPPATKLAPVIPPEPKPTPPAVKPPPAALPDIPKIAVPPAAPLPPVKAPAPKAPPVKPQPPKPQVQSAPAEAPPSLTGTQPIVHLSPVQAWQTSVIVQITNLKKWPAEAVRMKITGTVVLFIRIDRQGNILEYGLRGSSGYRLLDQATLDMARRAVKLAPLPPQIPGADYQFNLQIDWY